MKNKIFITIAALIVSTVVHINAIQPKDILPDHQNERTFADGTTIRKGTVAATFQNARDFDKLRKVPLSDEKKILLSKLLADQRALMSGLHNLGFFNFFSPSECLQRTSDEEGRILIAVLYLEKYPEEKNSAIVGQLRNLLGHVSPELKELVQNLL